LGLLLAFFYEKDQNAGKYAYYGIMGMRHRGFRANYAAPTRHGIVHGKLNPWSNEWSLPEAPALLVAIEPSAKTMVNGNIAVAVDGSCNPQKVLENASSGKRLKAAVENIVHDESLQSCAILVLGADWFIAYRGRDGVRPLSLGAYGFDALYAASETVPITLMGGEYRVDIEPGQAVYGNSYFFDSYDAGLGTKRTSLFEYIYLARPDSLVDGVNIYEFRKEMGRRLAKNHDVNIDVVVGVPETALPYALGYAMEKRAELELALISTLGRVRTALAQVGLEERLMMLSLKLNPVPDIFTGKRVAIIDDSVVTGLTLKTFIHQLRRSQAPAEIHVAVSSPRITAPCPYNVQALNPASLIARNLSDEVITRVLDADSIAWLPLHEATSYLQAYGINPCTACMSDREVAGR